MDLGQWSSLWFFRKKLTSSCRSHRNISMTLKLWKLFSPSYNSSKRCFYAEGSFRCLMFVERSWHSNEEMLSLLDMLVHLPCVDAIAFLSVTRDDHVVRNVLCSHHAGYMILLLGEIPPQNRCAPDRPDQSPTFLTGTEGLKQQQPNKCLLFIWLLWQSVFGATVVEVLVPPAGKCHREFYCAHLCGEEVGETPAASSLILSPPTVISPFCFLHPPLSSPHWLVLTVPALHWWQSLSTVIRTKDVCILGCFPSLQPAEPFTRTWNHVLGWQSGCRW